MRPRKYTQYSLRVAHREAGVECATHDCVVVCYCRSLQCDRNTIHKNLVLCLLIAETVFIVGIIQYDKPVSETIATGRSCSINESRVQFHRETGFFPNSLGKWNGWDQRACIAVWRHVA